MMTETKADTSLYNLEIKRYGRIVREYHNLTWQGLMDEIKQDKLQRGDTYTWWATGSIR